MIRVPRSGVKVPAVLGPTGSAASRELKRAQAHFGNPSKKREAFSFSVYKHDTVKDALERLFHGKCAYCESRYKPMSPMDVEHYRPKGGVIVRGTLKKPGYWWLGADWDNLLPSCIDCNRGRYQAVEGEEELVSRGKENLFPITGRRASRPGAEHREGRLLLDPCRDEPKRHLCFGEGGVILPKPGISVAKKKIANHSIKTYGLDRISLNEERCEIQQRAHSQALVAAKAVRALVDAPRSVPKRRSASAELSTLIAFADARHKYSAVGSQVVDKTLSKLRPLLEAAVANRLPSSTTSSDVVARLFAAYPPPPKRSIATLDDDLDSILQ